MDPVAGRGASGEAPGSRLRMSYAGLLCLRSAESEVCVVTMSKRCPNEVRKGGSVHVGVGEDIALQIKHIALFTTPLENNIPTHQKYATYTTYGNPTPLFRWSAIRRCDGCLIEVHIRHLHCFYTVCTVVRRASESDERCTGGAAHACPVRKTMPITYTMNTKPVPPRRRYRYRGGAAENPATRPPRHSLHLSC